MPNWKKINNLKKWPKAKKEKTREKARGKSKKRKTQQELPSPGRKPRAMKQNPLKEDAKRGPRKSEEAQVLFWNGTKRT